MNHLKITQFIRVCIIAILILIVWLGFPWADSFTITPVFDNPSISGRSPSLNNKGQIAYVGSEESSSIGGDIYFFDGTKVTNLTAQLDISASSHVINDQGQIAFEASSSAGYDVYFYNGSVIRNITANLNMDAGAPSLNDLGQIAFHTYDATANHWDIYFYDGTTLTNITAKIEQSAYSPILNNKGQIVFRVQAGGGRYDIWFYNGTSLTKITDVAKIFIHSGNYDSLSFNNLGQIAFIGGTPVNGSDYRSDLYFYDGSSLRNLSVELNIPPGMPRLNDKGEIAFPYYNSSTGLWDLYFYDGTTIKIAANAITSLTGNSGLNNMSQVAFSDGTKIYLYDRITPIRTIDIEIAGQGIWDLQLNDNGQMAFSSSTYWGAPSDIYFYDGTSITNITSNNLILSGYSSLNDQGQIAFDGYNTKDQQFDVYLLNGKSVQNITEKLDLQSTRPSLNETGQVAFVVTDESKERSDIYLYDGQNITNIIANLAISCSSPRLNDKGQIAFVGEDKKAGISDIYFYDGFTIHNITANLNISVSSPDLNDRGEIAFIGNNNVYLYTGGTISKITADLTLSRVATSSLNNKGQIAFIGNGSLYLYDREKGTEIIAYYPAPWPVAINAILNDLGDIAFLVWHRSGAPLSLFFFYGPNIDISSSITSTFSGYLSLNNQDQIAFLDTSKNNLYLVNMEINHLPVAQAGPNQIISPGATVSLDGSGSDDPDGDAINYLWYIASRPPGSHPVISNPSLFNPSFTADVEGIYEIQLLVSDGVNNSKPDSLLVKAVTTDQIPLAYAGADQIVSTGSQVNLDSSGSYNPGSGNLTYNWSLVSSPENSKAGLSNKINEKTSFLADVNGIYRVQLVVENEGGKSKPDIITIVAPGYTIGSPAIMVAANKNQYRPGDTLELMVWVGGDDFIKYEVDAFIGFVLPGEKLYFLDPNLQVKSADYSDPRTYTPFAQNVAIPPGRVFPETYERDNDMDGNGKLDSYRLFTVILPQDLPAGVYYAFAALAKPGSIQSGNPKIFGKISTSSFIFSP